MEDKTSSRCAAGTEREQFTGEYFLKQFLDVEEMLELDPHLKTVVLAAMAAFAQYRVHAARAAVPPASCRNPNHALTDGSPSPHEIGSSCMAECTRKTCKLTGEAIPQLADSGATAPGEAERDYCPCNLNAEEAALPPAPDSRRDER
jgi:hypothetical protein